MAGLPPIAFCTSAGRVSGKPAVAFTVEPSFDHADTLPSAPVVTPASARSQSESPFVGTGAFGTFTSGGGTYGAFVEVVSVCAAGGGVGGVALDVVAGASGFRQAARTRRAAKIAVRFM